MKGISDFRIPGQFLIKRNCHISRTIDDIDIKLGPVTKLDKRNKATSKKFDDDVISENYDVIVILSLIVTFYLTRTESRTKKSLTELSYYCF